LLEPCASTRRTHGSEGAPARQRAGATRLGDDRDGELGADAGDLIQAGGRGQYRGAGAGAGARAGGAVGVHAPGGPDGGELLAGQDVQPGDPGIDEGDLVQQQLRQLAVVVLEHPGQRRHQGVVLGFHPAAGQPGQHLRVTLPGDQRPDHVPGRRGGQRGSDRRHLDQRVLQQLLQPLPAPGPVLRQPGARPGVAPQHADLGRRHERRTQQPLLGQPGQPHRVQPVGLGPARQVPGLAGIDQLHRQPGRL